MNNLKKLTRETRRILTQPKKLLELALAAPRRYRYDRSRGKSVRLTDGALASGDEMAVVVIYQPDEILGSTLFTLSWLGRQQIAPVLVSSHPLTDADRDKLARLCHLVIERPNVGYDFGAYREGILTLLERSVKPRSLFVLNDSIWFPLHDRCDVIERSRQSGADLFSLVCNRTLSKNPYLQSYLFRVGRRLLESDAFRDYWQTIPMLSNRDLVIRRLEHRMSAHFATRGYSLDHLYSCDHVTDLILNLQDDSLENTLRYMMEANDKDAALLRPLLESGRDFAEVRPQIEALIKAGKVQRSFLYTDPRVLHRLGVPFLKKARKPRGRVQRRWLRAAGLEAGFAPEIRSEIANWD